MMYFLTIIKYNKTKRGQQTNSTKNKA